MQRTNTRMRDALRDVGRVLVAIVLGMVVCWLLGGCSPRVVTKEVPVTVHDSVRVVSVEQRVDTIWQFSAERIMDTLWLDTSTVASLGMPTIRHDRLTERTTDKGKVRVVSSTDTIYVEREVPVTVKDTVVKEVNRLRWWQKLLMTTGTIGIITMMLFVGAKRMRAG